MRRCLLGFVLFSCGCFTAPTLHTARTVMPGAFEAALAANLQQNREWTILVPTLDVAVRRGFTPVVDAGARVSINGLGLSADVNLMAYNGPRLAVSFDPTAALSLEAEKPANSGSEFPDVTWNGTFWLPLLLDVLRRDNVVLTVGGRAGYKVAGDMRGLNYGALALLRIGLADEFALQPEGYVTFGMRDYREAAGTLSFVSFY